MPTVIVAATQAWLTDPTNPGGPAIQTGTRRPSEATDAQDGELRVFVGNRTQAVRFDSATYQLPITFEAVTVDELAQLSLWKWQTLLLRTIDGARFYGAYGSLSINNYGYHSGGLSAASATLQRVSYTDTV